MKTSCSTISVDKMNRRHFLYGAMLLPLVGCLPRGSGSGAISEIHSNLIEVSGNVFGSTYNIKYTGPLNPGIWKGYLENFFKEFNQEFSTYQDDSVINRLNRLGPGESLEVSPRFIEMLELAQELSTSTAGSFDPTLGPVIDAWGISQGNSLTPSAEKLSYALSRTGLKNLKWSAGRVWKTIPGLRLNVNAFAPGWAADLLGSELEKKGVSNYMIDIGGEILVKGQKDKNTPWVIGIEEPSQELGHKIKSAVKLSDSSISTSGSYRQFYMENGKRRPHIIDPRSGRPVTHQIPSVTVIAPSAAAADVWGTALMVLGEEGVAMAEKHGIKVLMLKGENHKYTQIVSSDMRHFLKENQI